MLEKNTQTTVYQRYAGPKTILAAMFDSKPISVADFGCGSGDGIAGLKINEPFDPIADDTPEKLVTKFASQKININTGLAIDRENPFTPESREWQISCRFYPSELGNLQKFLEFQQRVSNADNIGFVQKDIFSTTPEFLNHHIQPNSYDAVIICTMLYQNPNLQFQAYENAKTILKPDGVIIVQDFAAVDIKDKRRLDFDRNWYQKGNYRTFITSQGMDWEMKEVLKWGNGRCKEVSQGESFNIVEGR